MRDIKFRGLSDKHGWAYGDLRHDRPDSTAYYATHSQRICWSEGPADCNVPVKNGTVGQFTGLKDQTGKDIYEGDILRSVDGGLPVRMEVYFGTNTFDSSLASFCFRNHRTSSPLDISVRKMEVIGNIHENPELLNPDNRGSL